MSASAGTSRRYLTRLHSMSLVIVVTGLYLAAIAGSLYTLEMAYYIPAKKEVVVKAMQTRTYLDFELATGASAAGKEFADAMDHNVRARGAAMAIIPAEAMEKLRAQAEEKMRRLIDACPVITEVRIDNRDGEEWLAIRRKDRLKTQHDFSNSLFTRTFETSTQNQYAQGPNLEVIAIFRIFVTTARDNKAIEDLTRYYRGVMITFVLLFTLIYYGLLTIVINPLSRVLYYMQMKDATTSPILPQAGTILERAYNNLARDAALTRLSKELRDHITSKALSHTDPVLEIVPGLVRQFIGVEGCQVWTFSRRHAAGDWSADKVYARSYPWFDVDHFKGKLLEAVRSDDPGDKPAFWSSRLLHYEAGEHDSRPYYCEIISMAQERLFLFIVQTPPRQAPPSAWWVDFFRQIAHELRYALSTIEEQRRLILQEKSKANISLSRNLGHDLTNIIATSKLELMTIKTFLSLSPEDVKGSPNKQQLFSESLEALLNNTRFLQEIVNLYRSFSYLQKPKFEEVGISELVNDVADLYKLSLSRSIRIDRHLQNDIPPMRVEPRLLRLALFNILTNAFEAIKRGSSAENPEGVITVYTELDKERHRVEIRVEDTGSGIRDEKGNLLTEDSLSEIFRLGFSTKSEQEGEGLGLNWVQTIVREFHGGEVTARNRRGGGAAFAIRLPLSPKPAKDDPAAGDKSRSVEDDQLQEV